VPNALLKAVWSVVSVPDDQTPPAPRAAAARPGKYQRPRPHFVALPVVKLMRVQHWLGRLAVAAPPAVVAAVLVAVVCLNAAFAVLVYVPRTDVVLGISASSPDVFHAA
jgi:hypothetical protein